jgi:hemoglobin
MAFCVKGRGIVVSLGIAGLSLLGCESMSGGKMDSTPSKSLYERLGGEPAVTAVVADFVSRAAGDPAVNFTRSGKWQATPENVEHLKKMLVQFLGEATGGPQKYTGRKMEVAHAGMKITEVEFGAIAADLKATLAKFKVPEKEQSELMEIVGGTHDSIVQH